MKKGLSSEEKERIIEYCKRSRRGMTSWEALQLVNRQGISQAMIIYFLEHSQQIRKTNTRSGVVYRPRPIQNKGTTFISESAKF